MAEEKKVYKLNVGELDKMLKDRREMRIDIVEGGKEMVLFDIKRIVDPDGLVSDNNNALC